MWVCLAGQCSIGDGEVDVVGGMQWVKNVRERSATHPLEGSVVQRLQRFATYGSLKQQVLRIITDELAANDNDTTQGALEKVRRAPGCPA